MIVAAIDPGTVQSAYVEIKSVGWQSCFAILADNVSMSVWLANRLPCVDKLVIERMDGRGSIAGDETHETNWWSGRFYEIGWTWTNERRRPARLRRSAVKTHLCGRQNVKDANVNQALRDKLCQKHGFVTEKQLKGTKKVPGPYYGYKKDLWAALAVAITWVETTEKHRAA